MTSNLDTTHDPDTTPDQALWSGNCESERKRLNVLGPI
jgi:hypothetical protein